MNKVLSCLALGVCMGILPQAASAQINNYYVSTTGSDSHNGLTPGTAWATITHASQSISLGASGTVVHVAPGIYNQTVITSATGTASRRVTFISDTKWAAKIAPTSVRNGYAWYNGGSYSTIQNFEIYGPACNGIENDASFQNAIGNNVHNSAVGCSVGPNGGAGIDDTNYKGQGNQTLGNFVHDIGADSSNPSCLTHTNSSVQGIYHSHTGGAIMNNLVVNACADGISLWHAASHTSIVNNTVIYSGQGIDVGSGDAPCSTTGCSGNDYTLVYNNISAYNMHCGFLSAASDGGSIGTHNKYAYNLAFSNPSGDFDPYGAGVTCSPGCISGKSPVFVSNTGSSAGNFAVSSTSPAVGAGTTTDAPSTDYSNAIRTPPITIGAFQVAGGSNSAQAETAAAPLAYSYWKLDDGSSSVAIDSSGNDHTMHLVNSPVWQSYTNCVVNGCLAFNGTNQSGSVALDLSSTNVITITFWMKWNTYHNDDKLAFEFGSNFNNSTGGFLIDPDESSSGRFWVSIHGNAGYNSVAFTRPSAGVWHHYAFVLNKGASAANEITPYVDGTAVPYTKAVSPADNTNNFGSDTLFGMSRNGSSLFGAGLLDEIRIYTTALSPSDIAALAKP